MSLPPLPLPLRALARTPLVTAAAVISLSLGIGANAAIYSLFDQTLLRALPVGEPGRLVNLSAPGPKPGSQSCNQAGDCDAVFSYGMFRDLERVQTVFTGIAGHRLFGANLAYRGQTLSGDGMLVSGSYFPVLGIQPSLGRLLGPGDDRVIGESHVVVLSDAYWRTRFNLDPGVLNQALIVNGQPLTIVGVAPRGFQGTTLGATPQVFVPITLREQMEPFFTEPEFDKRRSYWVYLFARLKPGVSTAQARAAVNVPYRAIINEVEVPLQKGMSDQTMRRFRARQVGVEADPRGQSSIHREARTPMGLLLGLTGLVVVMACANIANLLLARGAARSAEMGVRLSIGASRGRLVRQLLAESCVLAFAGGALGLVVAHWTLDLIASLMPNFAATALNFEIDGRVLLVATLLAGGTGLLFGLFPALHATRPDVITALKSQSGQPGGARAASLFRTALATLQVCLSLLLLVSAGLFVRSLFNVSRADLGLKIDHVVTFGVAPMLNGYTPQQSRQMFERLEDELAATPGVTGVTAAMVPLLAGNNWGDSLGVEGFDAGPDTDTTASYNEIAPAYFGTLGVPLIAGRDFSRADAAGSPKVAIVNEAFARKFRLGRNAVGRHLDPGGGKKLEVEIVGLVADAKYSDVKDAVPPQFFQPYRQDDRLGFLTFYVRTGQDPDQLLGVIPKVVARLDPNLPVDSLRSMSQQVRENVFLDRFITVLSAAFACLATLLAAIGLYGVLAYAVAQRTREIGLRMALGATPGSVRRMVLAQTGLMTAIGGSAGLVLAGLVGRYAQSLLYELKGYDPAVFLGATVTLVLIAFAAGFVPAQRASRIDPMRALRYE
jgi:predicted permease